MRTPFLKILTLACAAATAAAAFATADARRETGGVASAPAPSRAGKAALATWFGPGFYGQTTACGQTLTPAVVGVANRTLPCGTLVKFSYRGHAAVVPVIDRGPYAHNGAQWDLTSGAASALGIGDTVRLSLAGRRHRAEHADARLAAGRLRARLPWVAPKPRPRLRPNRLPPESSRALS